VIYEFSFGIVPLRGVEAGLEVLLIHHRQGHWTLPKGHSDAGETPWETAERELTEETGLSVDEYLPLAPVQETYRLEDKQKVATYFLARVSGELALLLSEVQGANWYRPEVALQKLTYAETRTSLQRALHYLGH
jgi:8-oxo-dGTP pyrophosphatase MutT (NUDIX family)